jgi:diphosphomevalonate decarboxylase
MNNNTVILVNEEDQEIGQAEKIQAHRDGLLHRAFSVFIFYQPVQGEPELLLQQRHHDKYHCGGLWSNSCCSHPAPGETTLEAANRRLYEELGINTELKELGGFHYRVAFDNGLIENEMDHVLLGFITHKTIPYNQEEIAAIRFVKVSELLIELLEEPKKFTPWFAPALEIAVLKP